MLHKGGFHKGGSLQEGEGSKVVPNYVVTFHIFFYYSRYLFLVFDFTHLTYWSLMHLSFFAPHFDQIKMRKVSKIKGERSCRKEKMEKAGVILDEHFAHRCIGLVILCTGAYSALSTTDC